MDNIITGTFGIVVFLAFIGGLAHSINKLPFTIIVLGIAAMALYDFYENLRAARKQANDKAAANLES